MKARWVFADHLITWNYDKDISSELLNISHCQDSWSDKTIDEVMEILFTMEHWNSSGSGLHWNWQQLLTSFSQFYDKQVAGQIQRYETWGSEVSDKREAEKDKNIFLKALESIIFILKILILNVMSCPVNFTLAVSMLLKIFLFLLSPMIKETSEKAVSSGGTYFWSSCLKSLGTEQRNTIKNRKCPGNSWFNGKQEAEILMWSVQFWSRLILK